MKTLLTPYIKGSFTLKNRLVMAPMTRSRAIGNLPNALMAEYYAQRSGAGLVITEGTAPAPEALGYPRIPGIFSQPQIDGWRKVTDAVHAGGSKIFLQLMHTGRVGHPANLPPGTQVVGASAIPAAGQIYTDSLGLQDYPVPVALTTEGVKSVIEGYATAAKNAISAGFDGVEIHGANGYLPEQFLNPGVNNRSDSYGGSLENRTRFLLEVMEHTVQAIGKERTGLRISPFSTFGDMPEYPGEEVHATYVHLAEALHEMGIAYLHLSVNPALPQKTRDMIWAIFGGTMIVCNGLTPETATRELVSGATDLVAFARLFLANPDLDRRIAAGAPLNQPDLQTLYTPGPVGYTDYPVMGA